MSTAANLQHLLEIRASIAYYTKESISWNSLYEGNSEKLQKMQKLEEKWYDAYEDAYGNTRELKAKGGVVVQENNTIEAKQIQYANAKVSDYDENTLEGLEDLDIDYDTMKTMYDTLLEQLRAQEETAKQATSQDAQDTGMLNQ